MGVVNYGPDNPCKLNTCPTDTSLYGYRPSIAANSIFLALFTISMLIHVGFSFKWRTWGFLVAMVLGCVCEIIGYAGRIMLWQNPFSFDGFLIQIVCITFGPAFFSAAIYLTLGQIVNYLGPQYSRLRPNLYLWIFIPCDLVSLSLQGSGGGLSSSAGTSGEGSGNSAQVGVDIAIAGLAFQVLTLAVFIVLALDFAWRYRKGSRMTGNAGNTNQRFKIFVGFLSLAILCIFIRCIYRIDELSDGYTGPLIHNENLFIGLEGVMIVIAVFALNVAHPGPVFGALPTKDLSREDHEKVMGSV